MNFYKKSTHKKIRKLPYNLENPIDNLLVDIADIIDPFFFSMGITPNIITTFSLITGILMNYFYWKKNYYTSALMGILSYFFDCMDGNFARKYHMVTEFGDSYDHIKDILVVLALVILFLNNNTSNNFKIYVCGLLILLFVGAMYHLACQERYIQKYKKLEISKYLNNFSKDCNQTEMSYTRYVGSGTFYLFLVLVIIFH